MLALRQSESRGMHDECIPHDLLDQMQSARKAPILSHQLTNVIYVPSVKDAKKSIQAKDPVATRRLGHME